MGKIKKGKAKQGKMVTVQEPPNYNKQPVKFSLEKIQTGKYCFSRLDQENKASFAESIYRRKNLTWNEIFTIGRHSLGTEKMPVDSIRCNKPAFITQDVDDYMVFRYKGNNPMVGYREKDIFYVLWFDHDLTLYDHG